MKNIIRRILFAIGLKPKPDKDGWITGPDGIQRKPFYQRFEPDNMSAGAKRIIELSEQKDTK